MISKELGNFQIANFKQRIELENHLEIDDKL
jgi:hypothetical protein